MTGRSEFLKRTPAQAREDRVRRLQAAIREMEEHDPELLQDMEIGETARRMVGAWSPGNGCTAIARVIRCDSGYVVKPGDTTASLLGEIAQSLPYLEEAREAVGSIVFKTKAGLLFKVSVSTVLEPVEPDDPLAKEES